LALITLKQLLDHAAEKMHKMIRALILKKTTNYAKQVKIIYGGSLTPENSNALFSMENIDGGLVGRCSIDSQSFMKLCHVADQFNCGEKA
jgi:triosephosphate isomerase